MASAASPSPPEPGDRPDGVGWPSAEDPDVAVLHPAFTPRTTLVFLLPWTPFVLLFFLLASLIGGFVGLFELMGAAGPLLFGVVAAALYVAVLVYTHRRQSTKVDVLVSATGVECRDLLGTRLRLRWSDVTHIGPVRQFMVHRAPRSIAWPASAASGRTAVGGPLYPTSPGLIGYGERVVPSGGAQPGRLRSVLENTPNHPQTGRPQVAIAFNAAGPPGRDNPLLAWAWHHRPDLFSAPTAPSGPA